MANPLLGITDGTTTVNLINRNAGIFLSNWTPSIAPLKGGGTYQQGILSDGKQLVMTNYDNAIETFGLKISTESQDSTITTSQELLRLLEKARAYWTVRFATEPVWLFARAPNETNTRYAIIHNYQQSGLDNPYAQPFFSCNPSAIDDISLVVERGHWSAQIPGQPDCVAITASSLDSVAKTTESVTTGNDDASVDNTGSGISLSLMYLVAGGSPLFSRDDDTGVRFSAVDVDDSVGISQVILRLISGGASYASGGPGDIKLRIYGEAANSAATFSTYANFAGRARTTAYIEIEPDVSSIGDILEYDVTDMFNEIRDRAGWSDGNAMVFFIEFYSAAPAAGLYQYYASYENAGYDEPQLDIYYNVVNGESVASCENKNYVADKYNQAALTHIYTDDGGAWSGNLVDSTSIDLFPAIPAVNDAVYFGCEDGPFTNVVMYLDVKQEDLTIVWEWWQGAPTTAWTAFPANDIKDETDTLQNLAYKSLSFLPPYDQSNGAWTSHSLVGIGGPAVTAHWIRARVTAVGGSPVRPETSTIACYTVTWPYIAITEDEILGDISALGAAKFSDAGIKETNKLRRDRLIVALQSERGPYAGKSYNFCAYLPYSDEQLPSVIESINGVAGDFSYSIDVTTPSGRALLFSPSGTGTQSVYTTVDSSDFFGKYRVFARLSQAGGSDNHFFFQVTTQHGSTVYASTNEVPCVVQATSDDTNWALLDLGEINIPTGLPARAADENVQLDIHMNIRCVNTTGAIFLCDLILMPADEWLVDLQDFGEGNWAVNEDLLVDSAFVPKADVRGLSKSKGSYANPIPFKTIGGKFTLPANKGSKLWVLPALWDSTNETWISDPGVISKVLLYKSERYLGLRGNR